jgi:YVTN family beta-propeller protein
MRARRVRPVRTVALLLAATLLLLDTSVFSCSANDRVVPSSAPNPAGFIAYNGAPHIRDGQADAPPNGVASPGVRAPQAPATGALPAATVLETLALSNRSLLVGNVVPVNGSYPSGVALDSHDGKLFVATEGGLVVVVNLSSDRIVATIPFGGEVYDVAYDASNGEVYATHASWSDSVSVINASTDQVTRTIGVGSGPGGITIDPINHHAYVMGTSNVTVINTSTDSVTGWISVGSEPEYAALDSSNGYLFVTNDGSNSVSIVDTATDLVVGSAQVGNSPGGVVYDSVNGEVYVVDDTPNPLSSPGSVTVLNGSTGAFVTTITVGVCPWGAAYDLTTQEVYVTDTTCTPSGNLTVINAATNKVAATIPFGGGTSPSAIVYDPSNRLLYAPNYWGTNVSIINGSTHRVVGTVGAGELPADLVYDPANGLVYVADSGGNEVAILNGSTGQEVGTIATWYAPDGLAYDASNGDLYVANFFSDNVSVINTSGSRIVASIPVGSHPQGVGYDPANRDIYVANCNSGNVSIIDGVTNQLIRSVGAGICPQEIVYDPADGHMYVSNSGPNDVQGDLTENVTVIDGASNRVTSSIPAGGGPWGIAYDGDNRMMYVVNWFSNNLTVINATTDTVVGSIALGTAWTGSTIPIAVTYDSLDQELFVTLGLNFVTGHQVIAVRVATGQILGSVDVGLFPWAVVVAGQGGRLLVANWLSGTISLLAPTTYPPPQYLVTFEEAGLARGTSWSVTLNGTTNTSEAADIGFLETNGRYSFTIVPVPGYLLRSPENGSVPMSGANVTVLVRFAALYNVTFAESGLPSDSSWTVVWNGSTLQVPGASLTLSATNGSYSFSDSAADGYAPTPANGTVLVNGTNPEETIRFVAPGPILLFLVVSPGSGPVGTTFTLSPLVSGGDGALSYLYFNLPEGCITANVSALSCTPQTPGNTTVEVVVTDSLGRFASANASLRVTQLPLTHPRGTTETPRLLGLPWVEGVALLAGSLALLGVAAGVFLWRRRTKGRRPSTKTSRPREEGPGS